MKSCALEGCDKAVSNVRAKHCTRQHGQLARTKGIIIPPTITPILTTYKEPLTSVEGGHGYMGTMATNPEKTHLQCHVCGYYFGNLGTHIRAHGYNARSYRLAYDINFSTPLMGEGQRADMKQRYWEMSEEDQLKVKQRLSMFGSTGKGLKAARKAQKTQMEGKTNMWSLERRNKAGNCPDQTSEKITKLAETLGRTPTQREFVKAHGNGALSSSKYFWGDWATAVKFAGLQQYTSTAKDGYTDEQLLGFIVEFRKSFGREPLHSDFKMGRVGAGNTIYIRRFGGITKARKKAGRITIGAAI